MQKKQQTNFLEHEVGEQLLERLKKMDINPQTIWVGTLLDREQIIQLQGLFPNATISTEPALENIPKNSQDLIIFNMALHWEANYPTTFAKLKTLLRPKGLLIFSLLGQDTLKELRKSIEAVTGETPESPLTDMHHIGDALVKAGFIHTVMEMDFITLMYKTFAELWQENKACRYVDLIYPESSISEETLSSFELAYKNDNSSDQFPATFELIIGHGFQPEVSETVKKNSEVRVSVDVLRRR